MHPRGRRPSASKSALLGFLTVVTATGTAHAQSAALTDEQASVRRLALDRAQAAAAQNNHEEALALAQQAGALQMTPSVRRFIAEQASALGQHADALRSALLCVREADTASSAREELRAQCQQIAQREGTLVSYVRLRFAAARPANTAVEFNGRSVDPSVLGLPYPVDAGELRVRVTAPGARDFTHVQRVLPGASVEVAVALEALAAAGELAPPSPGRPSRERERGAPAPSVGPWVLVGVGGVLVAASIALFVGTGPAVGSRCRVVAGEGVCDTPEDAAHAQTWVPVTVVGGHVALYTGLAAAGTGLLWWGLTRGAPRSEAPTISPAVALTPGGVAVTIGGAL